MQSLIEAAGTAYAATPSDILVNPSVPTLYFGDKDAYLKSPTRIVTVALNPSRHEFPPGSPFSRFPAARAWQLSNSTAENKGHLQRAYDDYFRVDPYSSWFGHLENVLRGFDASFNGTALNTAIHTDLLSPIATNPTWSGLSNTDQSTLAARGVPLWHELIHDLRPHLILISVAKAHLSSIRLEGLESWRVCHAFPAKPNFPVMRNSAKLRDGSCVDLLYARAAQVPFGLFTHLEKNAIGPALLRCLNHW